MTKLVEIATGPTRSKGNVIFVHGLDGNPYTTWGGNGAASDPRFWPAWLAEDLESLAIYSLDYPAAITKHRGDALWLDDQSHSTLRCLLNEPHLREAPLAFVTHSMGGLVVKKAIQFAILEHQDVPAVRHHGDVRELLDAITQVIFIATPHLGAHLAAVADWWWLRGFTQPSEATMSMVEGSPALYHLNEWYRKWAPVEGIGHLVFGETKKTRISIFFPKKMIVSRTSVNPTVEVGPVFVPGADHFSICKPSDRKSELYRDIRIYLGQLDHGRQSRPLGHGAERIVPEADPLPKEEVRRVSRVFVRPNIYGEAKRTLLENGLIILQGPGSVGKTTTGVKLLVERRRELGLSTTQPIWKLTSSRSLEYLEKLENALILLDAPFGERDDYEPADPRIAAQFGRVVDMSERNWVVVTTRPEPLEEARRRIERRALDRYIINVSFDSYDNVKLRRIFLKHVAFRRINKELTLDTVEFIRDRASWIVSRLQFPHNIATFVKYELHKIRTQEDLKVGLDRSKDTKEAAKRYFLKRNSAEIYFMLAVAFFGQYLQEGTFLAILQRFFSMYTIPNTEVDVSVLLHSVRYVRQLGSVTFEHQDYLDGVLDAVRNDRTIDSYIKRFAPLLQELSRHSDKSILKCLGVPLRELARVDPQSASPITLDLLRNEDPYVVRAAYIPLRVLVNNAFETVRPFLEKAVTVDQVNKKAPDYRYILFHKAMRKYLLVPPIERCDVETVVELRVTSHRDLGVEIFIVQALYDVYRSNQEKAISFFREWWRYEPRRSLTALQNAVMTRGGRAQFVAELLGAIAPEAAVKAIVDWSRTESKREEFRARIAVVLGECLKYFTAAGLNGIGKIIEEWKNTGNDIQRSAAQRFGQ